MEAKPDSKYVVVQRDGDRFWRELFSLIHTKLVLVAGGLMTVLLSGVLPEGSPIYRALLGVSLFLGAVGFPGIASWQPPRLPLTKAQQAALNVAKSIAQALSHSAPLAPASPPPVPQGFDHLPSLEDTKPLFPIAPKKPPEGGTK